MADTVKATQEQKGTLGQNVSFTLRGNLLTLEVDLSKSVGPSKSGRNLIVASTGGNQTVGSVKVGLNIYKSK